MRCLICTSPELYARGLCKACYQRERRYGNLSNYELRTREPLETRFWREVQRTNSPDDCWNWTGSTLPRGYGCFYVYAGELDLPANYYNENEQKRGMTYRASRVAFYLQYGRWPEPNALHGCDNPPCCNAVNPRHIHEGTQAENVLEAVERGRWVNNRGYSILTKEQAVEIRTMYRNGYLQREIATIFDVAQTTISRVIREAEAYQ